MDESVGYYNLLDYGIVFVSATLINVIVLLNLLIAIISAKFEEIRETQTERGYQEKAKVSNQLIRAFG
jgi:hypothetical protein